MIQSELEKLECMEKCDPNVLIAELIDNQRKIKTNYELYYDEKQDQSWINHYYCNISPNTRDLFQEYHELITKMHQYKHRYYISKD
ncbi:hypothetical protein DFR56_101385 [Pseudogracilibacillus auburnensis]|uniref:Uncharacterized protein n=2 Tax=Pseudogracilibacillus auburnensis TaxID=1494959 RepID=A0A2V3W7W1_9BACI|nr:hypothetical protein DFR56_101385 [Pseudogracilibacillus auburnensis]